MQFRVTHLFLLTFACGCLCGTWKLVGSKLFFGSLCFLIPVAFLAYLAYGLDILSSRRTPLSKDEVCRSILEYYRQSFGHRIGFAFATAFGLILFWCATSLYVYFLGSIK